MSAPPQSPGRTVAEHICEPTVALVMRGAGGGGLRALSAAATLKGGSALRSGSPTPIQGPAGLKLGASAPPLADRPARREGPTRGLDEEEL